MPDGSPLIIGDTGLGALNTGTQTTSLNRSGGSAAIAFDVNNDAGIGIAAGTNDDSTGIAGASRDGSGVAGWSLRGVGVEGDCDEDVGVFGSSGLGTGVFGLSSERGDVGVYGRTNAPDSAGVLGDTGADSAGVWGYSGSSSWPAVEGYSFSGNGVRGVSVAPAAPSSVGVVGYSTNGIGVVGITGSPGSPSSYGGYFIGGLITSGGPKSAAVPHPDGSHRLLYSMESPESWFEDFGRTKLVRGKAKVKLESAFAAVVRTDDYHVFLTPEGETNGLHVSSRSRLGFEVREQRGGRSNARFSYRVVARRKDIKAPRLPKIVLPSYNVKDLMKSPAAPKVPKPANTAKEVLRKR